MYIYIVRKIKIIGKKLKTVEKNDGIPSFGGNRLYLIYMFIKMKVGRREGEEG